MIRTAELRDLKDVADLIRSSFDQEFQPYMVYAQHGAAAFLGYYLRNPRLSADRVMLVAQDDSGVALGFAEFRLSASAPAHLSYICVHPKARGRGLARELIRAFVERSGFRDIDLYVFERNVSALALYRSLGMEAVGQVCWFVRKLPAASEGRSVIRNLPTALAAFDRFGFCELHVSTAAGIAKVGRIGTKVLRCSDWANFCDEDLLGGLAGAFPETGEALLIAPKHPGAGHVINRSVHMSGRLFEF